MPAADFHGQAAEHDQRGVDPQNGRQRDRAPVKNPVVVDGEMTATLTGKKSTHQGNEEHEVAGQGKKQDHAVAAQQIAGSTAAGRSVLPILAVSTTTGGPAGNRRFTAKSGILALCLNGCASEGSRHGSNSDIRRLLLFGLRLPLHFEICFVAVNSAVKPFARLDAADRKKGLYFERPRCSRTMSTKS